MLRSTTRLICLLALASAVPASAQEPDLDAGLQRLVADYIDLYRRDRLPEWKALFLPTFTVASTADSGRASVRASEQFFAAQERGFARSREMGERLENVRIHRQGRLGTILADFVFWQDADTTRGRLTLHAIAGTDGWRFHSLMFTYHP
jgi:hypothetical protein